MQKDNKYTQKILILSLAINVLSVTSILYLKVPRINNLIRPHYSSIKEIFIPTSQPQIYEGPKMPYEPEITLSMIKNRDKANPNKWKQNIIAKLKELINLNKIQPPIEAQKSEKINHKGYSIQHIQISSQKGHNNIVVHKLMPVVSTKIKPYVILAIPGSGAKSAKGLLGEYDDYHRGAAVKFVKMGYAVYVMETFGSGEREINTGWLKEFGITSSQALGMYGMLSGEYLADIHMSDLLVVIEYIKNEKDINPNKIVAFGISRGGVLASIIAAISEDISGAVIASGLYDWDEYAFFSFGQVIIPNQNKYFLNSDITGAIAPKPILISFGTSQIGNYPESPIYIEETKKRKTTKRVQEIYKLFNAKEKISISIHEKGHTWDEKTTYQFLKTVFGY